MEVKKLPQEYLPAVAVGLVACLFLVSPAFAATDPWQNFLDLLTNWIVGNLGKMLALISVIVGAVISLATHRFQPLVWSIIIGVVIGGAVGLAKLFFSAGGTAFGTSW